MGTRRNLEGIWKDNLSEVLSSWRQLRRSKAGLLVYWLGKSRLGRSGQQTCFRRSETFGPVWSAPPAALPCTALGEDNLEFVHARFRIIAVNPDCEIFRS